MTGSRRVGRLPLCLVSAILFAGCGGNSDGGGEGGGESPGPPEAAEDGFMMVNYITLADAPDCKFANANNLVAYFKPGSESPTPLPPGTSGPYDFTGEFGLQLNFWYWAQAPYNMDTPGPIPGCPGCNNPDNSGGQFQVTTDCRLTTSVAVFGKGIPTYGAASVTASNATGSCILTITANGSTACTTPGCCDYGINGGKPCESSL